MSSVTPKQRLFVAEYAKDHNGTQAAIRAGYSAKTAPEQASRLLAKAKIRAAVGETTQRQIDRAELSAARVLEEYRRLAFSDVRDLFDESGNLRPIHTLTPTQASALASIEVVKKNAFAGDGQVDTIYKVRAWDKTRALEALAKHFGLLTERVEHHGELVIKHEAI